MTKFAHSSLYISLNNIVINYLFFAKLAGGVQKCAAVLKADSYGLGAVAVANALYTHGGCRDFYVFNIDEALALKAANVLGKDCRLLVLSGIQNKGEAILCKEQSFIPVLNNYQQFDIWHGLGDADAPRLNLHIHVDTGMNRLGFDGHDIRQFRKFCTPNILKKFAPTPCISSHFVYAEEQNNDYNQQQLDRIQAIKKLFPDFALSLANSSGALMLENYNMGRAFAQHYRVGLGLWGVAAGYQCDDLKSSVKWSAKIIQIRTADAGETVGYKAQAKMRKETPIAIIGAGYADGVRQNLWRYGGVVYYKKHALNIVGVISMDSFAIDLSPLIKLNIPIAQGDEIDLFYDANTWKKFAQMADISPYEVISNIGTRVHRCYDKDGI